MAALAVVVGSSAVADESGWYVGANLGQSRAKIDDTRIVEDLLAEEVLSGRFPKSSTVLLNREDDHLVITEVIPGAPEVLVTDESK